MKFGPVPVAEAEGAILAHSTLAGRPEDQYQSLTYRIAKGTVLTRQHVQDLAGHGVAEVVVARLSSGDEHEDVAAQRLAEALVWSNVDGHLRLGAAATGRVNLYAEAPGIVSLDAARIDAFNRIDPMISVATVPAWQRVTPGTMVATIKVISYAVASDAVKRAMAAGQDAIGLRVAAVAEATLIETQTGPETPPDKGRRVTGQRLTRLGAMLSPRVVVPHQPAPLAEAIKDAPGELVLVLTGSATSDAADTLPLAIMEAGGEVIRFGMPVDPGNLLVMGRVGERPVIGLPGCARSPALNGADWVLERIICGIPPEDIDIAGMGVGGF